MRIMFSVTGSLESNSFYINVAILAHYSYGAQKRTIRKFIIYIWEILFRMSDLVQRITAPNGMTYEQPIGLFINNKWVKSSNGQKIASVNPA